MQRLYDDSKIWRIYRKIALNITLRSKNIKLILEPVLFIPYLFYIKESAYIIYKLIK